MGMFDTIICEYPIAGGLPTWIKRHPFQTKDLECMMEEYRISVDGTFSLPEWTGTLNFYSSNVVGSGPGIYTTDGEDAEYLDCMAKIVDGKVSGDIQVQRRSHKAWPVSKMHILDKPTKQEVEQWRKRIAETLMGKRLYVLWGGQDIGYWVTVIAENRKELCVRHEADAKYHKAGDFELLDRRDRDRIFWDSDTEALAHSKARKDNWEQEKAEFVAFSQT
jgi:hypothetical protein